MNDGEQMETQNIMSRRDELIAGSHTLAGEFKPHETAARHGQRRIKPGCVDLVVVCRHVRDTGNRNKNESSMPVVVYEYEGRPEFGRGNSMMMSFWDKLELAD